MMFLRHDNKRSSENTKKTGLHTHTPRYRLREFPEKFPHKCGFFSFFLLLFFLTKKQNLGSRVVSYTRTAIGHRSY